MCSPIGPHIQLFFFYFRAKKFFNDPLKISGLWGVIAKNFALKSTISELLQFWQFWQFLQLLQLLQFLQFLGPIFELFLLRNEHQDLIFIKHPNLSSGLYTD